MANLITPNKAKHKYVVGIDFGHGETSAAICPIEWDKQAGQRETKISDIDLDRAARLKVITSAICRIDGGIMIGDQAFEHMTDNNGIRICFKKKPVSIDGEDEKLMIDYMNAVYKRIRESQEELSDDNHIVYIARPSGWVEDDAKELYRQMAIKAGIPLGGLTSESRAAIFYAKSPNIDFSKTVSQGAIVFDLGSSTLDFTYLSDKDQPVDYGYDLGASIIDNAILEKMILKNGEVSDFLQKYPTYRDSLKFKARKFKEDAYGRNPESKTVGGFVLSSIIADDEESFDDYADVFVRMRIANLAELNDMIESSVQYMSNLKQALIDFKESKIPGKTVKGVFLTGGASRMNFIRPLISETFGLPIEMVKIDNDNPSLTISRGIALLGSADAITSVLVSELRQKLPSMTSNESLMYSLISELSYDITMEAWSVVESASNEWVKSGKTTDENELKDKIELRLLAFKESKISSIANSTLQKIVSSHSEDIRKKMNEIISQYAPGREITSTGSAYIGHIRGLDESMAKMSSTIAQICDSITNKLGDILWAALGFYLWGIFCLPWYLYKMFRSDESKRKAKADDLLEKKKEVTGKIREDVRKELTNNAEFKNEVSKALSRYFNTLIESNLQQVIIPIE